MEREHRKLMNLYAKRMRKKVLIYITLFAFLPNYLYLCTYKKRKQYDTATKQAV